MMSKKLLIAGLLLLCSNIVTAGYGYRTDGNDLLYACNAAMLFLNNPQQQVEPGMTMLIGHCAGLIEGIIFLNTIYKQTIDREKWGKRPLFCGPMITTEQGARMVVKYLNEHPEELNKDRGFLTLMAFVKAYPCQ